jgi:hypothetical protein
MTVTAYSGLFLYQTLWVPMIIRHYYAGSLTSPTLKVQRFPSGDTVLEPNAYHIKADMKEMQVSCVSNYIERSALTMTEVQVYFRDDSLPAPEGPEGRMFSVYPTVTGNVPYLYC